MSFPLRRLNIRGETPRLTRMFRTPLRDIGHRGQTNSPVDDYLWFVINGRGPEYQL